MWYKLSNINNDLKVEHSIQILSLTKNCIKRPECVRKISREKFPACETDPDAPIGNPQEPGELIARQRPLANQLSIVV
jgi:hypothetical protein